MGQVTARDWMHQGVITCRPDTSVDEVAETMEMKDISALVVDDEAGDAIGQQYPVDPVLNVGVIVADMKRAAGRRILRDPGGLQQHLLDGGVGALGQVLDGVVAGDCGTLRDEGVPRRRILAHWTAMRLVARICTGCAPHSGPARGARQADTANQAKGEARNAVAGYYGRALGRSG